MTIISTLVLAAAVWLIIRRLDAQRFQELPCCLCYLGTRWNGEHWVHANGERYAPWQKPPLWLSGDPTKPMLHAALPDGPIVGRMA